MDVPNHFSARPYQANFLAEIRNYWFVVMEWARRGGKGLTTFVYAAQRMVEEPMGVMIIYPTGEQGYRSFWNNLENDGFRTIEHIPPEMRLKFTDTKDSMSMVLKNGSTLDLVGLTLTRRNSVATTSNYTFYLSSLIWTPVFLISLSQSLLLTVVKS
jgi:hypothetical protein